jgi:hypothetical protein
MTKMQEISWIQPLAWRGTTSRLMTVLVCLATACSDDSSGPKVTPDTRVPEYVKEWQTNIWAYAVDDSGSLYVSQFNEQAILKYSNEGELLDSLFVVLSGDTLDISGLVCVGSNLVTLGWSNVIVLDKDYKVTNSWPEHHPRNITFAGDLIDADPSGNIYVLDDNYNRVAKYSFDGAFRLEWNIEPHDSVDTASVSGIAVTSNGLVCVDQGGRNRILIYSSNGKLLHAFGRHGRGKGQLDFPGGIDESDDVIYVADAGNIRVEKFTLLGGYLSDFYSFGTYGQGIDVPRSVVVHGNKIFVMHGQSIIRFDYVN